MLDLDLCDDEVVAYSTYPRSGSSTFYNTNFSHYPMFLPFERASKVISKMTEFKSDDEKFSMIYSPEFKTEEAKESYKFDPRYPTNSYLPLWEDRKVLSIFLSKCLTRFIPKVTLNIRDVGRDLGYGNSYLIPSDFNFTKLKKDICNSLEKWTCVTYEFVDFRYNTVKNGRRRVGNKTLIRIGNVIDYFSSSEGSDVIVVVFGSGFFDSCFHSYCKDLNLDIELSTKNALAGFLMTNLKAFEPKMKDGFKDSCGYVYGEDEIGTEKDRRAEDNQTYKVSKGKLLMKSGFYLSSYSLKEKLSRLDFAMLEACEKLGYHCKVDDGSDKEVDHLYKIYKKVEQ